MTSRLLFAFILFLFLVKPNAVAGQKARKSPFSAYLFTYFTGNSKSEEAIRFAISKDGFTYRALNNNEPVILSENISETGGVRDPHILRGADGKTFYMVVTDMVSAKGWSSNRGMVLLKSTDLINWTSSVVNFQKRFGGQDSLLRVWAPQTIYDDSAKKYMVYFSLKHGSDPDKIYYAYANASFTDLETEPKQLFYSPDGAACIDGDIVKKDGKFYLFFKTEDRHPGIKIAMSDRLTHGYKMERKDYVQQTKSPVEGAGTFRLNNGDGYVLMYDMYTSGCYQFTKTKDLQTFAVVDEDVRMNFHPRHGTVMPITAAETGRLVEKWLSPADVVLSARNSRIRPNNTAFDTAKSTVRFLLKPGTDLKTFDPAFTLYPGVTATPISNRDFARGPVNYRVRVGANEQRFTVQATVTHNPVLTGNYADPDLIYA
ncbi:MAG: beta-xylosidase, partial [Chitinophagaceae bacterium]